jgi:hypothetical protein
MTEANETIVKDQSYYMENPDELTPELIAEFGIPMDSVKEEVKPDEPEPVVLAKDGKHTIPFSELEDARERAKLAQESAAAAQAELAELRESQKVLEQERADLQATRDAKEAKGLDTSAEDEQLAAFDEDYPSISEVQDIKLRRALSERDDALKAMRAELDELKGQVAPIKQNAEESAFAAHVNAITDVHKDYLDIIESDALTAYAESLPYKQAMEAMQVIDGGNAKQVIDLVTAFKASKLPPKTREIEERVPTSLSDFSGAVPNTGTDLSSMDQMELIAYSQSGAAQHAAVEKYLAQML